ncbi:MAG: M1 family metallopeptidase, partial [Acidimicrobiales bacterium]
VQVDGQLVDFSRTLSELTIEFGELRPSADPLAIRVVYSGVPEPVIGPILGDIGWLDGPVGSYVVSEPTGTPTWFPVNDHPIDKATYTFVVTVPDGWEAVANGQLVDEEVVDTGVTFTWEAKEPLAPYLATIAVGQFEFTSEEGPNGVVIRHAFPPAQVADATFDFGRTAEMIDVFNKLFGPYPFEAYGALVVDDVFNFALEDQTFSVFTKQFVTGDRALEWIYAHELAHQWFGDSVSVADWSDIWLNEGFATYAEQLWSEFDSGSDTNLAMDQMWQSSVGLGPPGSPGADRLFATEVYDRGALALHALRLTVGDDPFFEILSAWTDEYAYSNATTDDFIVLAERVSGQDLLELIDSFVYGETLPPLPE